MSSVKDRARVVKTLLKARGSNCGICGKSLDLSIKQESNPNMVTVDHVLPKSYGGSNRLSNLRLAHYKCNQAQGKITEKAKNLISGNYPTVFKNLKYSVAPYTAALILAYMPNILNYGSMEDFVI